MSRGSGAGRVRKESLPIHRVHVLEEPVVAPDGVVCFFMTSLRDFDQFVFCGGSPALFKRPDGRAFPTAWKPSRLWSPWFYACDFWRWTHALGLWAARDDLRIFVDE